jgi:D-tyrosyl-tRNA(Tyr) deacylase
MIGLLQRVTTAQVAVGGAVIAAIDSGLLVLVGVEAGDGRAQADRLLERLLGRRAMAGRRPTACSSGSWATGFSRTVMAR